MHKALTHEDALAEHGPGIKRAYTYKALNKLIQGSAADMTKKAMLELYKEGIIPHIQVHDELDISVESPEQAEKIKEIMESAVDLEVPNKVDYESGPNWGK
jgi:DNA polymerase I-like protein with 3'-5' exonuclease and polymerase domains